MANLTSGQERFDGSPLMTQALGQVELVRCGKSKHSRNVTYFSLINSHRNYVTFHEESTFGPSTQSQCEIQLEPTRYVFCIPDVTYNLLPVCKVHEHVVARINADISKLMWAAFSFPYSHIHSRIVKMLRFLTNVRGAPRKSLPWLNLKELTSF